jgi:pilus assembly protein CpaC
MEVGGVHQVQLNVKVMEVQRTKIRQLGFNFLLNTQDTYLASTPGSLINITDLTTPFGGPATVGFTGLDSAVQFAIMGSSTVFNGFLDALRNENLLKILAEPELVTTSGRPATILSGGEFPILVPQSLGTVTIEWREFGVRMEAVPVVLGNGRLRLDVAPEVSERDFSNSVTIEGMVVPGITTRRVNTQVEMRFGETLMIGGLISSRKSGETNKVPFLGELPWVGTAFRTVRHDQSETELMILVTPHMVAPLAPHQVPHMGPGQFTDDPTDRELYFDGMLEVPLYGPECSGCETMGGYGAGMPGGYGGYGGGMSGGGAYCGDGCLTPAQAAPNAEGLMVPEETQSEVQPLPPATGSYEGGPQTGAPLFNAPPLPAQGTPPAETQPVNQDAGSKLPPMPGQVQTAPATGPNQPASLGLIDPFRRSVRTGQVPVEVQTQSAPATTTQQPVGHSTSAFRLIRPRSDSKIIQTGATLSAPQPARSLIR